jgi:hypothetical protein
MARTLCFGGMPKITQGGGCAAHFTGGEGGFWPMNSRNSCKELLQKITRNGRFIRKTFQAVSHPTTT